ncbi:hypothetical protein ABE143_06895 [Bacillus subtilis]|uniref:hypothetical protein n=1 Tax=unclassified Bacillus (in: firmicutes) TaxID=185979 RepID=UPI000E2E5C8A|nr:hypothetical protein [Bacillus sp. MT]RFB02766.1 hypothetical protein DZB72_15325 [Bacillus sp. MT]
MKFEFDKDRIINNIKRLGGEVELNSSNPGVFTVKDGKEKPLSMEDIFPDSSNGIKESNVLKDVHVTMDETSHFVISKVDISFAKNNFSGAA